MLVIRIWNYFRGYVIIKIEGLTLEKFINLTISKNIILWDIVRVDYTTLMAKVSVSGYKELRDVVQKVGCRVYIAEKRGFPFFVNKFKYRKMLAIGSIIAVSLVIFFTSFIWNIEVIGNEKIDEEVILKALFSLDIKEGVKKSKLKNLDISNALLLKIPELSYANVEIQGTKMIVEVKERNSLKAEVRDTVPCNIVASKKAVIEKVIVKMGKSKVDKGDVVREGQVLISGVIEDERLDEPLLVHSEGNIIAKVWYSKVIEEPIEKYINEETGNSFTTRELIIGNKRIQLMNGEIPFENYIIEKNIKEIGNLGIVKLPLEVVHYTYKEVKRTKIKQNVDSLKQIAAINATKTLMEEIPEKASVISKDVKHIIQDNILITEVIIEVYEDIGIKEKINTNYNQED